tara:strand:+ start:75 stop:566 length:492 start_codon:yes stop_codon:yes gene_type:complete
MSQKKVDYSKSIIYKLCCKNPTIEEIYIGSTTNMRKRKSNHKTDCHNENTFYKKYNCYKYEFIRNNGGFENWDMIMIEEYNCNSKRELEKRERYWIDELKPVLNSIKSFTTKEEQKKCRKEYCETNKKKIKETTKQYKEKNKETLKNKNKEYREKKKLEKLIS